MESFEKYNELTGLHATVEEIVKRCVKDEELKNSLIKELEPALEFYNRLNYSIIKSNMKQIEELKKEEK